MLCCHWRKLCFHRILVSPLVTEHAPCLSWFLPRAGTHTCIYRLQEQSSLRIRKIVQSSGQKNVTEFKVNFSMVASIQRRIEKLGTHVSDDQIKRNWNLLKSVGCSDDHINCYPKILTIPTPELMKHISRLQEIGCHQISVGALRISRIYKRDATECEKRVNEFLENEFNLTSWDILRCNQSDVDAILDNRPSALDSLTSNPRKLKKNVDLLYEYGYTVDYFLKYSQVLNFNHDTLQQKLDLIREIESLQTSTKVGYLVRSMTALEKIRQKAYQKCQQLALSEPERLKNVAKLFKLEEKDLVITSEFKEYCNKNMIIKNKVDILEEARYKLKELQCKPVIFRFSEQNIKQAVEFIKTTRPESSGDIMYLVDVLEGNINKRHKDVPERLTKHIAHVLDVPFTSFTMTQKRLFGNVSLSKVDENLSFLKEKGFSLNEIRTCPLILVQDVDMVHKCYDEVQTREDLQHFREDKVKCLNAMQYLIEYQSADYEE